MVQDGLDLLKTWYDNWQLMDLSLHKCVILYIGNDSNKSRNVCHSYVQLPVKTETSDLGVIVDSKLRFDKHIASIVNKAHARAALIRRCFSKDFIQLFRSFTVFVRPMLEYCSSV